MSYKENLEKLHIVIAQNVCKMSHNETNYVCLCQSSDHGMVSMNNVPQIIVWWVSSFDFIGF